MNDNTILRIKVPAHLYESVKEQLTINEAKKEAKAFSDWKVVKEKKAPKKEMEKVEEVNNIEEIDNKMEMKNRTLDELKAAKAKLEKKIAEMENGHKMEEAEIGSLMDPNFIAGLATLLGVGGTLVTALVKDLKNAKSPEEKKQVFAKASDSIETAMGK